MKVYIKNMVCASCRLFVQAQLVGCGLHNFRVENGLAEIFEPVTTDQLSDLNSRLKEAGLEITRDSGDLLVDKIKKIVLDVILASEPPTLKFSEFLSRELRYDYSYLSHLFATRQGMTLEHYMIAARIEKVKELLVQEGLTLTGIADRLYYCSVQHLSAQFKKVTGFTPSEYRKRNMRRSLQRG